MKNLLNINEGKDFVIRIITLNPIVFSPEEIKSTNFLIKMKEQILKESMT